MTWALLAAVLTASSASPEPVEEPVDHGVRAHLELTLGFMGGGRDYRKSGFTYATGAGGDVEGGRGLVEPMQRFPYVGTQLFGPTWEVRAVVERVRLTIGVQKPFTAYSLADGTGTYPVGGVDREVSTRALSIWELRFGLGYEYTFGRFTPFVDLIGHVDWISSELTVDAAPATYRAQSFAFAAHLGVRVRVGDYLFIAPSGEVGITGDIKWGAQLVVGVLIPLGERW